MRNKNNNFFHFHIPKKLKWLRRRPAQPQIQIPEFLASVDLPQAQADDSANVLREKAAAMLEAFANVQSGGSIQRDSYTWLDLAQKLAQGMSPGERVTRDDLHMLVDQLQNPGCELYLQALGVIMKIT
jgi:hypothetical protein